MSTIEADRIVRLVESVTGIECSETSRIGQRTTISGFGLHAAAAKILADQGKHVDDATAAEYMLALERAYTDDYDQAGDVFSI